MKLSTAAFQAYNANPGCFGDKNQYIDIMVPESYGGYSNLRDYFDFLNIHNYAFNSPTICDNLINETPESCHRKFFDPKEYEKMG